MADHLGRRDAAHAPRRRQWRANGQPIDQPGGDLIAGKRPSRDADDTPHAPRGSAVPSAGKGRKRGEPDAGLEPQPQG